MLLFTTRLSRFCITRDKFLINSNIDRLLSHSVSFECLQATDEDRERKQRSQYRRECALRNLSPSHEMSSVSGPSKKRLKQSSLLEFVTRMKDTREHTTDGMDSGSGNQTEQEPTSPDSDANEPALSQTDHIQSNASQSTDVDLSQDLFPDLEISSPKDSSQATRSQGSSQESSHSSSSGGAAVDDSSIPSSFKRSPECGVILPAVGSNHTVFCKASST
ncbi:unnamed protein product, partial [Ixodes hexagonus]